MPNNEIPRLSRLTAILTMLQSKRLVTATTIANKFDISIRTVYRDIKTLVQAGIPVFVEEGKGYSIMDGYAISPIMFTEAEANALITAEQLVLKNTDESFVQQYTEAITKIKAVFRHSTKDKAELLSKRILFRHNKGESNITSHNLSLIQLAITNFSLTTIKYLSISANKKTERVLEPFALYSTQENWVLIAWCRLRKDYRAFRLDRIQQIEVLEDTFEPHKISLQEYFEICKEKYFNNP